MSNLGLRTVLRHLRRVAGGTGMGLADAALLERFVAARDEAAFELLVWRHGPMVLGVCRRVLGHEQDAEDAFQATFLTLARKAASIGKREALSSWLYQVAYRTALRARTTAARRSVHVLPSLTPAAVEPEPDLVWRDLRPVLDEELSRLPEKYRLPVILCDLEGKTHEEAARQLGCPRATIATRLGRARDLLRLRLTRRGLTLPVGAAALVLVPGAASAQVPAPLLNLTLRTVSLSGATAARGLGSRAAILAEGVLREMFLNKVKSVAAVVLLAVGVLGVGTGALLYQAPATEPAQPAQQDSGEDWVCIKVPSQRDGVLLFVGTDIRKGEKVPPDQVLTVKVGGQEKRYRRLKVGDVVEEGQLLARVDDRLARDQLAIRQAAVDAAEADHRAAVKSKEEAKIRYDNMTRARETVRGAVSDDDYRGAKLTWDRYREEAAARAAAIHQARAELQAARTVLDLYEIHSSVRGVIRAICKHRGEAVRDLEPIFLIRTEERLSRPAASHTAHHRVQVPSERDGKLIFLATDLKPEEARLMEDLKRQGKPLPGWYTTVEVGFVAVEAAPGEQVPPEQQIHFPNNRQIYRRWQPGDPLLPNKILVARQLKGLHRLEVGMSVQEGQLLGLVNPALALDDVAIKIARLEAAEADRRAAVKTREEAERRYDAMTRARLKSRGTVSDDDYRGARFTWDRYIEEQAAREATLRRRQRELEAALTILNLHEIRATQPGVIRRFCKYRGEGVKYLEPVLELEVSQGL